MEGKETPKTLPTSLRSMPRSRASNTLSLRSFEYAFMSGSIHEAQPSRNALSERRRLMATAVRALGEVALRVNDLDKSQVFYADVIGLELMKRFEHAAFF